MNIKKILILTSLVLTIVSCTKAKSRSMDISELDIQLVERANLITNDYFTLAASEDGYKEFRNKNYFSNVARASLNQPLSGYSLSPIIFKNSLGEVSEPVLINVENKGLVKRFQYTVTTSLQKEPIDFWIDINQDYRLSKMFLYIPHPTSGKRTNIFNGDYIKF